MPGFNAYWAKYGCTKCNNYKLLVVEFNPTIWDTKEEYKTDYLDKYNVKYPAVFYSDGGKDLDVVLGNMEGGGPEYLIKPDKTFLQSFSGIKAALIDSAGGNVQHVCNTGVCVHERRPGGRGIAIQSLTGGRLRISVRNADVFRISACTVDGKLVSSKQTRLEAGDNTVGLSGASGPARVMVISVKGGEWRLTQKVVWRD